MKDVFMYGVQATVLGMAVVYGFLFMLEMFINLIKKCIQRNDGKIRKDGKPGKTVPRGAETKNPPAASGEDWLPVAVGIFMLEEEEGEPCSAGSWTPINDEKARLWILSK